ncbi:PAS domain S-box protein [Desulforhopalus vacuolatus]|uniref:hybrid sensor histidine kinase/response regulator n=1 Tax=Desulforhopalus vacuolatus TaxID=40414 RepID=UPI001962F973|nr:PAS domain-containing sensor histidine kinase [Desulforhopalus vacuolatus]MBM9518914.1 PAS domain S-box protein [Desulforhopalus vacuolatus]
MLTKPTYEELQEKIEGLKRELHKSECSTRKIQSLAKIGNWEWDIEHQCLFWSDEIYCIFGLEPASFKPSPEVFEAAVHPDDLEGFLQKRKKMLREKTNISVEHRIVLPDSSIRYVNERTQQIINKQGEVYRVIGTVQDITERIQSEKALKESEEKYHALFDNSLEAIFLTAQDGKIFTANKAACEMLKMSESEIISYGRNGVVNLNDPRIHSALEERRKKGKFRGELTFKKKDGSIFPVNVSSAVFQDSYGNEKTCIFFRDISKRKLAEQALEQEKKQWEITFDSVWDWVSIIDKNHNIIRSNTPPENFINIEPEKISCMKCYEILHKINFPIPDCPLKRAVKSHHRENMEIYLKDSDRWVNVTVDPIRDGSNQELFVHVVRDITEIKNREYEILSARKAEAFSILAGGIAHDYNNLLSVIWGNISFLREEITDGVHQKFLDDTENACRQARNLTHQFITLSEGALFNKNLNFVEDILNTAIKKTENTKNVKISVHLQDKIPAIEVDPFYLEIAFRNIIQNSLEAILDDGKIEIQAEIETFTSEDEINSKRLKLSFTDNGRGIPEYNLENVFDPYFTTKEMGAQKGAGLGLSVSKSIIKKHGGDIQIYSKINNGSMVTIRLPVPELKMSSSASGSNTVSSTEKPIILIMEDDPSRSKLCSLMLRCLNCTVITANCLRETIEKYLDAVKDNIKIDLILLNQNITGDTGGVQTLIELRKNGYDNEAVLVTESPDIPAMFNFRKYGFDAILFKPYTKKELKEIISQFLLI